MKPSRENSGTNPESAGVLNLSWFQMLIDVAIVCAWYCNKSWQRTNLSYKSKGPSYLFSELKFVFCIWLISKNQIIMFSLELCLYENDLSDQLFCVLYCTVTSKCCFITSSRQQLWTPTCYWFNSIDDQFLFMTRNLTEEKTKRII